jgi:hypothetical protein
MASNLIYHENGGTRVTSRVYRFVDQTDRSQKAVSEHKTLVRSHVMTEIRRQKRSKVRLEPETWPYFHYSPEGRDELSPDTSHWRLQQVPSRIFDPMIQSDSTLAGSLLPERDDGYGRQSARATSHRTCDLQRVADLQAMQASDFRSSGLPYNSLRMRTSHLKPARAQTSSSAEVVVPNSDSGHEILLQDHRSEERSKNNPDQTCSISISPTILGASRVDPFRALPISANREVNELVDNCECSRSELRSCPLEDSVDKKKQIRLSSQL